MNGTLKVYINIEEFYRMDGRLLLESLQCCSKCNCVTVRH